MSDHYILNGHEAVPAELMEWARWFEKADRRVARSEIEGGVVVSTVFLGLDHQFFGGPPLIFETMVFGGSLDQEMERYTTWEQAEAGHAEMVERAKAAGVPS